MPTWNKWPGICLISKFGVKIKIPKCKTTKLFSLGQCYLEFT